MDVGFLLFPGLTQLDLTGPWEVFARVPGARTHLIAETAEPVSAEGGLTLLPTTTMADAPELDVLVVPGGAGVDALLSNDAYLDFLRGRWARASTVLSVCTGSLLLGAAGLLDGARATCHWTALEFLPALGAVAVAERVVEDGKLISGAGVTAGIDAALVAVARIAGESLARSIQLQMEYDPQPPFDGGSPSRADPDLVLAVQRRSAERRRRRAEAVAAALNHRSRP